MQTTNKKCAIYEWLYILLAVTLGEVSVVFIFGMPLVIQVALSFSLVTRCRDLLDC